MKEESLQKQYEKMTETRVSGLVLSLAAPAVVSTLVTNLYNMADTFFVSQIGTSASGSTGIVFALMAVIQAVGFMFGHGAGSNISRLLGARKVEEAGVFASLGFFASIACGFLIMSAGFLFQEPMLRLLGSTGSMMEYTRIYSSFILLAAPAMASSCVMNNILRYEGKAFYGMIGLASGGILNIFGDYVLIFGMQMGIAGAGLSTLISQYAGMLILLQPFLFKKTQSRISMLLLTWDKKDMKNILITGMPNLLRQSLNSFSAMALNHCAAAYGDAAIASMSITARVAGFIFCVGIGLGQGFQPVSGFNYGAGKYQRVEEAFRFTCGFSICVLSAAAFAGGFQAGKIMEIFSRDSQVIQIGTAALRAQAVGIIAMPVSVTGNMLFQSTGKSKSAMWIAALRSGLIFIPVLFLFSHVWGLQGIQYAQPVSDFLASAVTIPFIRCFFHQIRRMDKAAIDKV